MWRKEGEEEEDAAAEEKKVRDSERFYLRVNNLKERRSAEGKLSGKDQ